jgi:uncharacterized membrane protein
MAAIASYILQTTIIHAQGQKSALSRALGRDLKDKLSPLLYALGISLAFVNPVWADALYTLVAMLWLITDHRIEAALKSS